MLNSERSWVFADSFSLPGRPFDSTPLAAIHRYLSITKHCLCVCVRVLSVLACALALVSVCAVVCLCVCVFVCAGSQKGCVCSPVVQGSKQCVEQWSLVSPPPVCWWPGRLPLLAPPCSGDPAHKTHTASVLHHENTPSHHHPHTPPL